MTPAEATHSVFVEDDEITRDSLIAWIVSNPMLRVGAEVTLSSLCTPHSRAPFLTCYWLPAGYRMATA